ncbi:MAG: amidohydrolase family protein [Planctomycetota bacterium]
MTVQWVSGDLMVIDPARSGAMTLKPGTLKLVDGHIDEQILGEHHPHPDWGGADCIIAPGWIDAHVHLPQFDMIGAHGLPLLKWLHEVTFPEESRWADVDHAAAMTERVIGQFFAHGTVMVAAYATAHAASTRRAMEIASRRGLRGLIGHVLLDRECPQEWITPIAQQIEDTAELIESYPPGSKLSAAVTPRFAVSCSEDLLSAAGSLTKQKNAFVQTHVSETLPECQFVREHFDGRDYVQVYANAGLITPQTLLGHAIHLSDRERDVLAEQRAVVVHCPTANSFLRSGAMNRHETMERNVRLALGSDVGAGYERSMVRVARAMIETAAALGDAIPTCPQAWWQITHGNALALGLDETDRLSQEQPADLLVIRPDVPWRDGAVPALNQLLFSWDDRWIRHTLIAGEPVYSAS